MANAFKEIVLLQGLHPISDYHFRMIKSLLANKLKLKGSKYEEYDKIKFADMMAEKFQSDAGLGKLISLFSKIPELEDTAELLKKEKAKVLGKKKCKVKDKTSRKRSKQDKFRTGQRTLTKDEDFKTESVLDVLLSKKKESSTKKTDDLGRNMVDLKMGMFPENSITTTGLQSPHIPTSSSFISSSAKEKENTITKRDNSTKALEIKGSANIVPQTGSCLQTPPKPSVTSLSSLHIPQMLPAPPNSQQSPQMPPHTSSRGLQTSQLHPETPSCSLQTREMVATPPNSVQILLLPSTTLSSSLQIPQMPPVASSGVQTDQKPPTIPSSSLKTPLKPPKIPASGIQILQKPLVASSSLQTPQKPLTTACSSIITPLQSSKAPSSSLHILPMPPVASSSGQTPQKLVTPSSILTALLQPSKAPSSSLQTPLRPPKASSSTLQTLQTPLPTSSSIQAPQMIPATASSSLLAMKPSPKYEPAEENGYQSGPKEVMVLKVTEPFTYMVTESEHRMIHATVATENAFFRVKVFDMTVKDKFIPKNIIAISNYVGRNGFLEINKFSSVSNVSADRKMFISPALIQHAKATPKISQLGSQREGKFVNGTFLVCKKQVRPECIYYEIQDNTGMMEVFVHGRLTLIHCEEGDKLNLTCFEVASSLDGWQLRSVLHSHLKVIKARKNKVQPLHSYSNVETLLESKKPGCH